MRMTQFLFSTIILSLSLLAGGLFSGAVFAAHGFAQYGDLKYPAGFKHFAYVNPEAPRSEEHTSELQSH